MEEVQRPLNNIIIRDLMLKALAYEGNDLGLGDDTFKNYGYRGSQGNLFKVTELLAIKYGLIEGNVSIPLTAWGTEGYRLHSGSNTNFTPDEIESLFEGFWILLNQHIIAPGAYQEIATLPYFHVTPHGLKCLAAQEILPYDIDGYLEKLNSINHVDDWVKSYLTEALRCFNANCHHAATIMIGLSAEKLTLDLIDAFTTYLQKYHANLSVIPNSSIQGQLDTTFKTQIDKIWMISQKYKTFQKFYDEITGYQQDIKDCMDASSRTVFYEYLRLTRNEVSHPNELKKDYTETMLLFVSFIKYIELITKLSYTLRTI